MLSSEEERVVVGCNVIIIIRTGCLFVADCFWQRKSVGEPLIRGWWKLSIGEGRVVLLSPLTCIWHIDQLLMAMEACDACISPFSPGICFLWSEMMTVVVTGWVGGYLWWFLCCSFYVVVKVTRFPLSLMMRYSPVIMLIASYVVHLLCPIWMVNGEMNSFHIHICCP